MPGALLCPQPDQETGASGEVSTFQPLPPQAKGLSLAFEFPQLTVIVLHGIVLSHTTTGFPEEMLNLLGHRLNWLVQGVKAERGSEELIRKTMIAVLFQHSNHHFQGFEQVGPIGQASIRVQKNQ